MAMLKTALQRDWLFTLLAILPLALVVPDLRNFIEARMSLHMLVEFPALALAGWTANRRCGRWPPAEKLIQGWSVLDYQGWTGATFATCVTIAWMVPSMLDASLLSSEIATLKYLSWIVCGWLLAGSWSRMETEVQLFFCGNLVWMMATAGLLYLDAPVRLCVNYLEEDQRNAGIGLVVIAAGLACISIGKASVSSRQPVCLDQ